MKNYKNYLWNVFKRTSLNRNFELSVFEYVKNKKLIYQPTYQLDKKQLVLQLLKFVKKIKLNL